MKNEDFIHSIAKQAMQSSVNIAALNTSVVQFKKFCRWCEEHGVDSLQVTRQELADYKSSLQDKGLKPATMENHLLAIRRFYMWCAQGAGGQAKPHKDGKES